MNEEGKKHMDPPVHTKKWSKKEIARISLRRAVKASGTKMYYKASIITIMWPINRTVHRLGHKIHE